MSKEISNLRSREATIQFCRSCLDNRISYSVHDGDYLDKLSMDVVNGRTLTLFGQGIRFGSPASLQALQKFWQKHERQMGVTPPTAEQVQKNIENLNPPEQTPRGVQEISIEEDEQGVEKCFSDVTNNDIALSEVFKCPWCNKVFNAYGFRTIPTSPHKQAYCLGCNNGLSMGEENPVIRYPVQESVKQSPEETIPPTRAEMVADPNCPVGNPPANVPYDALGYR